MKRGFDTRLRRIQHWIVRKLDNILTYGGALLAVFAFVGIDFRSVYNWLGAMNGRTAFVIVGIALFAIGIILKWQERKVSLRNVQRKISEWLKTSNFAFREIDEWHAWHFGFQITEPGIRMYVARVRGRGRERYITLIGEITPFSAQGKAVYDKLEGDEKGNFIRKIVLQAAISKISFTYNFDKNTVTITKRVSITSKLSESDLLEAINDVNMSATIIWNTIVLELNQQGDVTPPLPNPDTEASPPSQAS